MTKRTRQKSIFLIAVIFLVLVFLPFLFKKQEIEMDLVKVKEEISNYLPGTKLISETKSEFSYQISYLNYGDSDYSKIIFKQLKKFFSDFGWKIKQKGLNENYQLIILQPQKKGSKGILNVAISYQKNQGTFFGIDYHW